MTKISAIIPTLNEEIHIEAAIKSVEFADEIIVIDSFSTDKTVELAEKHNFKYKKVAIKNAKTRWGSCSYVNNINLSLHLMRLPDYLIDYVILHELVHTKIKNHSKDFWHFLDYVSGNAKKLDKELKDYRTHIY